MLPRVLLLLTAMLVATSGLAPAPCCPPAAEADCCDPGEGCAAAPGGECSLSAPETPPAVATERLLPGTPPACAGPARSQTDGGAVCGVAPGDPDPHPRLAAFLAHGALRL